MVQEEANLQETAGPPRPAFVYILECADGTLYTGWTYDLQARLKRHNSGKGAKYTRPRLPVSLAYSEQLPDERAARQREYALKQLTRPQKLKLIGRMKDETLSERY